MYKLMCAVAVLIGLSACSPRRPHVVGWGAVAADNWAKSMGKSDALIVCTYTQFSIDEGDQGATCSVNMGDRVYRLSCWVNYDNNDKPISRVCEQNGF